MLTRIFCTFSAEFALADCFALIKTYSTVHLHEWEFTKSLLHSLTGGIMKSKSIASIIAAVLVTLVTGCASVGAPEELFVESNTYNGG
ncbi:MAG TPA: hypothetical protein VNQ74_06890 [Burkholderiaceae bacterium]|nr:hypothetical protein [Burkholderiaceae bacterium]